MYGKLVNNHIVYAPKKVTINGNTILNPTNDILEQSGYYEIIYTNQPDSTEYQNYISSYEQQENKIVQVWTAQEIDLTPLRENKIQEMSQLCNQTITQGIDVELSTGIEHFSLTLEDQVNLFGKQAEIESGLTKIALHQDDGECKYYSVSDMQLIINAAMFYKTYHTTYFNSLKNYIKNLTSVDDITNIQYGDSIPEEYQTEVLKDILESQTL